jgi:phosphoribosylanthranilate isomerase
MADCLIKICGIRCPKIALDAVIAGANLIGIVFDASSPRYASLEIAKAVSKATQEAGATPVAVFVNQSLDEMRYICHETGITTVQLHGPDVRSVHHFLPFHYQRIYVLPVSDNGILPIDADMEKLDENRDWILIDSTTPGQGHRVELHNFQYPYAFPWILAGGLNALNVSSIIETFKPNGVDVSSGVESSRGNKDTKLIHQFIATVRGKTYGE